MKTVALGLFAISVGAAGAASAGSPAITHVETSTTVGAEPVVRSSHPAIDRILVQQASFQSNGHDKSTFDKGYDKAYDRTTYSKTYEKTYNKSI